MRVEAAEAAERQRQQAALEQQRFASEMELRRAEVAKKRPTWMLAVTGIAVVGIVIAGFVVVQKIRESAEEARKAEIAKKEALAAVKAAKEAQEALAKIDRELDVLNGKISSAVGAVADAQNDADRAKAKAQLADLQRQQYEAKQRAAEAKAVAERAERLKPIHTSAECLANPLAKGCD